MDIKIRLHYLLLTSSFLFGKPRVNVPSANNVAFKMGKYNNQYLKPDQNILLQVIN